MKTLQKYTIIHFLLTCALILITNSVAQAQKGYISDILIVSLRSGPGNSYRSIKALKSGATFTVLEEQNKFLKIVTDDGIEGWLPKQYTTDTPPAVHRNKSLQDVINRLKADSKTLKAKNQAFKKEIADKKLKLEGVNLQLSKMAEESQNNLQSLQEKHDSIQSQYNNILIEAKDTIKTKKEYDKLKQECKDLKAQVLILSEDNADLSDRNNIYWLLSGGGLLLLGMAIGKLGGKKQKSSLSL